MRAGSRRFVAVKRSIEGWQVINYAFKVNLDPVNQPFAFEAIPFKGIQHAFGTLRFNHKAN